MNNFKEIQIEVSKKFGYNCNAELTIGIYPIISENNFSLKVDQYDIYEDGSTKISLTSYINASSLYEMVNAIKEFKEIE